MSTIASIRRSLHFLFETLAIIAFVLMLCSSLVQVFCRYVLNDPLMWTEELARMMAVFTTYFGSVVVLLLRQHIYVSLLDDWLRGRAVLTTALATAVDLLVAWFLVSVAIGCWLMVEATWTTYTATMPWFRMGYVYLAIGIAVATMTLILVLDIYARLLEAARGRREFGA